MGKTKPVTDSTNQDSNLSGFLNRASQKNLQSPPEDSLFEMAQPAGTYFKGDSKNDIGLISESDQNEVRANNQTIADKFANGFVKMGGTALTTAAETFTSLPYGIAKSIFSPDGKFSDIYDNEISRSYDALNETLRNEFPNYYTKEAQEQSLVKDLGTANFWADKVTNGLGFLAGAYVSGGASAKLFSAVGKLATASALGKTINLADKGGDVLSSLNKASKLVKFTDGASTLGASLTGAVGEAGMEARGIKDSTKDQLTKQREQGLNNLSDEQIEDLSSSAGNAGFAFNVAIVGASNFIQFGKLFSGYNNERKLLNKITKTGDNFIDEKSTLKKVANAAFIPAEEAVQEGLQYTTEKGVNDYYSKKNDPNAVGTFNDMIDSTLHGLEQTLGTKEGLESMLIGSILGLGSVPSRVKQNMTTDAHTKVVVDNLNKYKAQPTVKALYDSAIRHVALQKDADKALAANDIFAFKNAQFDQFKNYIKSRIDANKFDTLSDELNDLKSLDKDEFIKTFGLEENADKVNVNDFIEKLKTKSSELKNINDSIDLRFPNLHEGIKERIFDAASNLSDIDRREKELGDQLTAITAKTIGTKNYDKFPSLLNILNPFKDSIIENIKEDIQSSVNYNKLRTEKEYKEKLDQEIEQYIKTVNPLEGEKIKQLAKDIKSLANRREDFIEKYNNLISPEKQVEIIKKDETATQIPSPKEQEKKEVNQVKTTASDFYNANKEGFKSLVDFKEALKSLDVNSKKEVLKSYSDLISKTIRNDEGILIQDVGETPAKEIPEAIRQYFGGKQFLDISTGKAFNAPTEETIPEEPSKENNEKSLDSIPPLAIKIKKFSPSTEKPTIVRTQNTEFRRTTKEFNGESYVVLETDNGNPVINQFDRDVFKTDFNYLSTPGTLPNGTVATIEMIETEKFGEAFIVKVGDKNVGKLSLEKKKKNLIELIKKRLTEGKNQVIINGKWGSSALHTEKTDTSLNDIKTLSPQNLPEGKIIIGTIKGDVLVFPKDTKEEHKPNLNNKVNGKHFAVLITPEGNAYPEMLWNTPVKDIKIGDKTVYNILASKISGFLTEINKVPNKKEELNNARIKWKAYSKENIDPIANFDVDDLQGNGVTKYSLDLHLSTKGETVDNFILVLKKGKKEEKTFISGKELADEVANRFFNINADLLESNQPFNFDGIDYPSYIDFLVDNKVVTTSIYPARPFAFTELDIETKDLVNTIPDIKPVKLIKKTPESQPLQATEEAKIEEDPKKITAREKLKKAQSKPNDTLTRPIGTEQYEHWDQEKELSWMKEVLPQIPIDVAKSTSDIFRKFGVKAHGIFSNATIYLANNSEVGTTYHEAFHAVFNLYLSNLQRSNILNSLRTNKNQTDLQLEEVAAEQFRDFVINKKEPSNKLVKFFNDILVWIKNQFGLLQANDFYNLIAQGKYANLSLSRESKKFEMRTRLIQNFNATEQKRRLDVTMKFLFDELTILQNSGNILSIDFSKINSKQLDEAFNNVKDIWEIAGEQSEDAKKVFTHFNDFKKLALKEFDKYGLTINPDYIEKVDEEKEEQEESSNDTKERIYSKAAFESSQKDNISREVKLYLATIPKVKGETGEGFEYETDDLGFTKFLDFHDIYNYVSDSLVGLETIDEMIAELEDLSIIKPELKKIIYDLKKNPSQENKTEVNAEKFRHKFFTTFSNQYIEFLTLSKNRKEYARPGELSTDKRFFFNIYETNKRSLQRQIVNKWVANYEGLPHNPQVYSNFQTLVDKTFKTQLNTPDNSEGLQAISNLLKTVGIDMSEDALVLMKKDYYKNNPKGSFVTAISKTNDATIGAILKAHHEQGKNIYSGIDSSDTSEKEIGERKAVNELAKFEKLVHVDHANASFLNGQNKTVYAINSNHYASKVFNRLRENTDNIVNNFLNVPYMKHSKILKDVQNDKLRKEFKLYVFDTVFDNDSNFEGTSYDELDTLQSVAVKVNMFNNRGSNFGYFHIPTPADRGNIQVVKLEKLNGKDNEVIFDIDGTLNINSNYYKWLISAIEDEYTRIKQTVEEWDGTNPIKNYHISKNGGKGNAYYFNQFYDLNKFYNLDDYYSTGNTLPTFDPESLELHTFLSHSIGEQFKTERKKLRDSGLIQLDKDGNVGPKTKETSKLLDDSIKLEKQGNLVIDNYIANYYYSNTELTKILSGDLAYYKGDPHTEVGRADQIADMNKRFGQSFVPGRDLSISTQEYPGGAKATFNLAISADNELASKYIIDYAKSIYDTLSSKEPVNFEKLFNEKGTFNNTEIYLRNLLGGYNKNNQTDAQGYITLDRLRNIMEGQGAFTGKFKTAWNRLNEGGTDVRDFRTVFNPIKGFYFNQEFKNGLAVPTQVKYSTVPLIPAFVNKYPTLKNLLEKMKDSEVDEFVFESGIKAGVQNRNTIDILATKDKLGFITLSNKNWRIPQIVPYKTKTKENFGSQIRKLITSNLTDSTYSIFGSKKSSADLKNIYQNILRANIKEGFDKLIPDFKNVEEISKTLLEEIQGSNSRSLPENFEKALEYNRETKDTRISLDFPLIKRKIENILNSLFDKKVVKQELPGFAAVQVSSFGVATVSNDLEFVRLENGIVKPADVLVSPQYFLNVLRKQKIKVEPYLNAEGNLDVSKISDSLLKVVLYRIPTQGKNSMLPTKIKGFLPSESGSQIIIPFEVTSQAGSDYDIDKVYIEMYNFNDNLDKVQYDSKLSPEENSLEARQNAIIDIHYSILTDPKHFSELITPNNSRTLKSLKDKIAESFKDNSKVFWHNLWVQEDLRSKNQAGKQLVGVYSIQSTSHSIAQDLDMKMTSPILFEGQERSSLSGQKNIDGNLISDDLSERQTAAVDNAKEPILGGLNDNKFTSSITAMIIRVGYGNAIPAYFINQPIIRYLTVEYQKAESTMSPEKALQVAIGKAEQRYDITIEKDLSKITPTNFNLKYLEEHISDNHKNSRGAIHHKNILETFLKYKQLGDALSRVSNALAIDTKGTSATISENIANLNNLQDALTNNFVHINRDKYNQHSIHSYAKYGVEEANEAIKQYLPLDTSKLMTGSKDYKGILTKLESIKGERLTPEEINKIVYDFYTYLHTHPDSNFSNITNTFKTQLLSGESSLSNRLKKYVKEHSENLNIFIQNLSILGKDKITGFDLVGFNNTGARTPEEKNTIMYGLYDLYNGTPEEHKLARDLAVYSFITFGFSRGVDTFIDYIPIEIYEKIGIVDFYKNIKKSFDSPMFDGQDIFNADNFINQYVQNNFKELKFVEKVSRERFKELQSKPFEGSEFIIAPGNRLYKRSNGTYIELNKLGYPNKLKEYSLSDSNLESIIPSNAIAKKQKQVATDHVATEVLTTVLDKLSKRFGIKYNLVSDSSLDYAGMFENGEVIINTAYAGLNTAFHEFAHPFIALIKKDRPLLYKNLKEQITTTSDGQSILDKVKSLYPITEGFTSEDQIEEAIVEAIGKYASNSIDPSTGKGLISAIKTLLERLGNYLRDLLGVNTTVIPAELDTNLTLQDIATILSIGESYVYTKTTNLADEFKLINKDGSRKKYPVSQYRDTLNKVQNINKTLRKEGSAYYAKIIKIRGEAGDNRIYDSIDFILKTKFQKTKSDYVNQQKEGSFTNLDSFFNNKLYRLKKQLDKHQQGSDAYNKVANEIKELKDKLSIAFKSQTIESYRELGQETLKNVSEYITLLEQGKAEDVDRLIVFTNDTINTWKEFPGLEKETRELQRRLYPFIEKNTLDEAKKYDNEGGLTQEKINAQDKDINTFTKGMGSLSDVVNYIGRTIGSIIKATQNRISTNNKLMAKEISEEVNKLATYAKSRGLTLDQVYDLFIQESSSTTILTKKYIGEELNPNYTTIQNTPELKRFYEFYQDRIALFQKELPIRLNKYFIPNIKKDNFKSKLGEHNPFKQRKVGKGLEEEALSDVVPMQFVKQLPASEKSTNLGASLLQFAMFSNNYTEMSKILPTVRLLQEGLKYEKDSNGFIKKKFFKKAVNPNLTVAGEDSNLYKMIDDVIEMQVKGKMKAEEWKHVTTDILDEEGNKVGEKYVDVSGIVDDALSYNSLLRIGLSPITAIANVTFGELSNLIEGIGGRFMTVKGLAQATAIFTKQTIDKESTLNKLLEELNPLQELDDYDSIEQVKLAGKTAKLSIEKAREIMYWPQKAGEKYLQSRTMLAVMIKDGYLTPNGEVTDKYLQSSEEEKQKLSDKIQRLNQLIHGRYSQKEAATLQQFVLYRLVSQFRKWIPAAIENRLGEKKWDNRLQAEMEGRYMTFGRMLWNLKDTIDRLKKGEFTELEIYNTKKMAIELVLMASSILLYAGLHGGDDEEDKKWRKNPIVKTTLTLLNRVAGDIDFFYNPASITKMARNAVPLAKTLEDLGTAITYIPYAFYIEGSQYKNGSRKGENKFISKATSTIPGLKIVGDIKRLVNDQDLEELR